MTDGFPMSESLLGIGKTGPNNYGWKDIRSVVSPAFTTSKMKLMFPNIFERSQVLTNVLENKCQNDEIIDVYEEFQALTMDVIGRSAFGVDADSLNNRNDVFYFQCRKFFNELNFEKSLGFFLGFISRPLGYMIRPFASLYKSQKVISDNLRDVIVYRKNNFKDYKRVDLIQLLLEADDERQKRENVSF
uniref:Cytochrome P450 n=1 Tax=Panagrolaimus sp. JU765 TaxID=591449 RepID=A0AC34QXN3_9BILA